LTGEIVVDGHFGGDLTDHWLYFLREKDVPLFALQIFSVVIDLSKWRSPRKKKRAETRLP